MPDGYTYRSLESDMDTQEFLEQMKKEDEYIEAAEETCDRVIKIWNTQEKSAVQKRWEAGREIVKFQNEYGRNLVECDECGYKNHDTNQECSMCNASMNDPAKKEAFQNSREITQMMKDREDGPRKVSEFKDFYRMFPDGGFDNSLAATYYEDLSYLARYPENLWRPFYKNLQKEKIRDKVSDEEARAKFGGADRRSKVRLYRQTLTFKWQIENGFAKRSEYTEEEREGIIQGEIQGEEAEELAKDLVINRIDHN